jgi:hypothetical protein
MTNEQLKNEILQRYPNLKDVEVVRSIGPNDLTPVIGIKVSDKIIKINCEKTVEESLKETRGDLELFFEEFEQKLNS